MSEKKSKFTTVQLPDEFIAEYVDPLVNNPRFGYKSRAEVVKDAVRNFNKEMKKQMSSEIE